MGQWSLCRQDSGPRRPPGQSQQGRDQPAAKLREDPRTAVRQREWCKRPGPAVGEGLGHRTGGGGSVGDREHVPGPSDHFGRETGPARNGWCAERALFFELNFNFGGRGPFLHCFA